MKSDALFQEITDRIRAQLEAGVRPWSQPWSADHDNRADAQAYGLPINIEGRPYRGANVFWLAMAQQARGYSTACWLTYNQARAKDGNVRKGETGTPVFFWSFSEKIDPDTKKTKKVVWAKGYTVFNLDQCEGVIAPVRRQRPEPERIAAAEACIEATGASITFSGDKAFYAPSVDAIMVPHRAAFRSPDDLYATVFHEIGHWTGHKSRLDRDFSGRFGTEAYAFEELVAELTAAFVCGSFEFANPERADHAAYIASWLRVLKANPRAFITAAGKAQAAADFILKGQEAEAEDDDEPVAEAA